MVSENEYAIRLSATTFAPGAYTFVAKNTGRATHALEIEGPGVGERKTDILSPGTSTALRVILQKGTYELYCPVDGHKDLGMKKKITVA